MKCFLKCFSGLDFPRVDWVVQVDAPENKAMYIHRVGRTARYVNEGKALLILLPTEESKIVPMLQENGIPIKKIFLNPKQTVNVSAAASAIVASRPTTKE